jgi:regulator of sirC expression with transglutaminase-like and TPR domain
MSMPAMITATINQVKALIQLLCTEESRTNTRLVREKLIELGNISVPFLEEALGRTDTLERERIESVLQDIRWLGLEGQFRSWAVQGSDLEEGAFLLARFCYPDLDVGQYRKVLDRMAGEVRPRIKSLRRSPDVVRTLNYHLFDHLGFHGNTVNYYDPDNSYLNQVIDQRLGIPISLSVVMLLVAKRLDLPLVGVGLPGHFLVRYEGAGQKPGPQIYIDPFNRGQVLTKEECTKFVKEAGYEYREEYFRTFASSEILVRMMRNLIFVYNRLQEAQKVEWLSRYVMAVA